jgi:methionine-gamma-lyase
MKEPPDFATRAIHAGDEKNPLAGIAPPIVQTSTFRLPSAEEGVEAMRSVAPDNVYTRWGNPTTKQLEAILADLEGGEAALAFGSGMGAISATIFQAVSAGDHLILGKALYAATTEMARTLLPRFGVETSFVDGSDLASLRAAVKPRTRMIFLESPTNPTLQVCDLAGVAAIGREIGVTTVVDNTFASPYNQNPLRFGIDVVVHSMTKYIGGHSDVTAGVVVGKRELVERAWGLLKLFGASLSPFEAWLLIRGLKTLAVRVERQNQSGLAIARYLRGHPRVERVHYPGLPDHAGHALAAKQMRGFGGMVSFELRGGLPAGTRLVAELKLITLAVSLGGAESLIVHPASMIHGKLPEEALRAGGISTGLLRLSVGLEGAADLIADLDQALSQVS